MISGSAPCRLRWIESTLDSDCFLVAASVFHRSIRSLTRSACVLFDVASSCSSNPFNCVIEAYDTGTVPCAEGRPRVEYWTFGEAAAGVDAGPDWPATTAISER